MINKLNEVVNSQETELKIENKTSEITGYTKEQVENLTAIKSKILGEINKVGFPDLEFLYSEESLEIIPTVLEELLEEEKKNFDLMLEKNIEEVTFEDVLFEDNGLEHLFALIKHLDQVKKSDLTEKIVNDFQEKYINFLNQFSFNKKLYEIYNNLRYSSKFELDQEQKRFLDIKINDLKLNGVNLDEKSQSKLNKIDIKLSKLGNKFESNVVNSESEFEYFISDFEIIKNLPSSTLEITKEKAKENGKKGYLFDSNPTSCGDLLSYCTDSNVRKEVTNMLSSIASTGKYDNRKIILDILKLKKEKANILGFKNYAEYSLKSKMINDALKVVDIISDISIKAKEKAQKEMDNIKKYFDLEKLEYWDFAFYTRKYKEEKFEIDEKELKKYFEYNNVLTYLFKHVNNFYGIDLKEIYPKVYDNDVKVYEIYKDNKLISYFLLDPYYSDTKIEGAFAETLRNRSTDGKTLIHVNVLNLQKSIDGKTLLNLDDVETLFHEFGHALHEILSESKYSKLTGFNVEGDFVELPSQINENWVKEIEGIKSLSKHYTTGESINQEIIDRLELSKNVFSGNSVLRQNEFALLDMMLYCLDNIPESVDELDKIVSDFVTNLSVFDKGEKYKIHTAFTHIFSDGYSAGYYGYMWAELLEADVFERIKEMGMFERETGEKFIQTILGQGTRKPASELFRDFMGRDLDNTAFMKRKGLL